MKCEDFETFLFDNPEVRELKEEFLKHKAECRDCKVLWEIQESLVSIGEDKIDFSFSMSQKIHLILSAKKEILKNYSPSFLEDSFIVSLIVSSLIWGIIFSIKDFYTPLLVKLTFFKVYLDFLLPFLRYFQKLITEPTDFYLVLIMLFLTIFSLTLFVKTITPKKLERLF